MPFSKCLRATIYSNMNVYFDLQGCQTLLLKESDPLLYSLGSRTIHLCMDFEIILHSCCPRGEKVLFETFHIG